MCVFTRLSLIPPSLCPSDLHRVSEEPRSLAPEVLLADDQDPDVHPLHRGVLFRQRQGRQLGLLRRLRGQGNTARLSPLFKIILELCVILILSLRAVVSHHQEVSHCRLLRKDLIESNDEHASQAKVEDK